MIEDPLVLGIEALIDLEEMRSNDTALVETIKGRLSSKSRLIKVSFFYVLLDHFLRLKALQPEASMY
jgi:hypothetical protein